MRKETVRTDSGVVIYCDDTGGYWQEGSALPSEPEQYFGNSVDEASLFVIERTAEQLAEMFSKGGYSCRLIPVERSIVTVVEIETKEC